MTINRKIRSRLARLLSLVALASLTTTSFAWEGPPAPELSEDKPYAVSVALGYISISGNSKSQSGNLKAGWAWTKDKWTWSAGGSFVFNDVTDGETGEETRNTEKYRLAFKADYAMWEKGGLFANLSWLKNEPSGIAENLALAAGFTRDFLDDGPVKFNAGLGMEGFQETKIQPDGEVESSRMAAYMQMELIWKLNEHNELKFSNESRMSMSDSEDYRMTSYLSYHSSINSRFAVQIGYEHAYKNLPVVGKGTTDTTTTVNLVYKF